MPILIIPLFKDVRCGMICEMPDWDTPTTISSLTSFVVMMITLYCQKKLQENDCKKRQANFEREMQANAEYYIQQIEIAKENARIAYRPFLLLSDDVMIENKVQNGFGLSLKITNIGNGMAGQIRVKYVEEGDNICVMESEKITGAEIRYPYIGYLFKNILTIGQSATFSIGRYVYVNGMDFYEYEEKGKRPSWVRITLLFEDSYENQYEQQVQFILDGNGNTSRFETSNPKRQNY